MSFAESQLAKFGWKQGEGLGKNKDGIKKSISVVKKNDTKGLGGKLDKWDFAWWDHVFNKSASNIQVNKDAESGEVKVQKQSSSEIQVSKMGIISTSRPAGPSSRSAVSSASASPALSSTSTMSSMVPRDEYSDDTSSEQTKPAAKSGPSWLFGFVKASASSTATEQAKLVQKDNLTSADSFAARPGDYDVLKQNEADEFKDYSIKVSDQELFLACEGRTARKGARGEQPGKLGRVMKELLIETQSDDSTSATSKKEKKEKKAKKAKKDGSEKGKETKDKKEKKDKNDKKKDSKAKKEKKEVKEKSGKSEKETKEKNEKKEVKEKSGKSEKETKEKNEKKEKKEKKDNKEKKEKKDNKEKKEKKEKKDKETKPEKSKKRRAETEKEVDAESQPKPAKKAKKSKSE
ncbi:G patch domain-containing protein 4 [Podila epigama]|nr:G patch domain-containing protein 4 [Podila epigama]